MISQRSTSVRALVIISTTVAAFVLLLATAVHAMTGGAPVPTTDYRVHAGDTLWSIAVEVTESGDDVRATIATIESMNGLDGAVLQIGQTLRIPAGDGV
jgi:LysM repeat protein